MRGQGQPLLHHCDSPGSRDPVAEPEGEAERTCSHKPGRTPFSYGPHAAGHGRSPSRPCLTWPRVHRSAVLASRKAVCEAPPIPQLWQGHNGPLGQSPVVLAARRPEVKPLLHVPFVNKARTMKRALRSFWEWGIDTRILSVRPCPSPAGLSAAWTQAQDGGPLAPGDSGIEQHLSLALCWQHQVWTQATVRLSGASRLPPQAVHRGHFLSRVPL